MFALRKGETRLVGRARMGMWEALTGRWVRLGSFKSSKILIIALCYFQGFAWVQVHVILINLKVNWKKKVNWVGNSLVSKFKKCKRTQEKVLFLFLSYWVLSTKSTIVIRFLCILPEIVFVCIWAFPNVSHKWYFYTYAYTASSIPDTLFFTLIFHFLEGFLNSSAQRAFFLLLKNFLYLLFWPHYSAWYVGS